MDKHRSNASSETHSDSSDSSNSKTVETNRRPSLVEFCEPVASTSNAVVVVAKHNNVKIGGAELDIEKDPSRRPSKDESLSSSSDSPSGDEYNVYYYDPKTPVVNGATTNKDSKSDTLALTAANSGSVLGNLKKTEDPWDILFARAEGLHAHGHAREACTLGVQLAEELLANPPDLMIEVPPMPVKGKRKKVSHANDCEIRL